jgi:hypothetical protein
MYSERFRTIFVHIPRTGGQSVEGAFLGKQELTWRTRGSLLLGRNPKRGAKPKYLGHLLAREYVELGFVAPDAFASCLKFTIARNPFDRVLSEYRYRAQKHPLELQEFLDFLTRPRHDRHIIPAASYVLDGSGKLMVDRVIRFESISHDFSMLSKAIFGAEIDLPHVNRTSFQGAVRPLSEDEKTLIYRHYECDFDLFRYPRGIEFHWVGQNRVCGAEQ